MAQFYDKSGDLKRIGIELRKTIPMSGHPIGYFMTQAIVQTLGKKALLEQGGNPFEFFRLYNRAAKIQRERFPAFSEKSMMLINQLEESSTAG